MRGARNVSLWLSATLQAEQRVTVHITDLRQHSHTANVWSPLAHQELPGVCCRTPATMCGHSTVRASLLAAATRLVIFAMRWCTLSPHHTSHSHTWKPHPSC